MSSLNWCQGGVRACTRGSNKIRQSNRDMILPADQETLPAEQTNVAVVDVRGNPLWDPVHRDTARKTTKQLAWICSAAVKSPRVLPNGTSSRTWLGSCSPQTRTPYNSLSLDGTNTTPQTRAGIPHIGSPATRTDAAIPGIIRRCIPSKQKKKTY